MKSISRILIFISFVGFIGIQFATIIDDPQHFWKPDPDCPICLAAKTEISIPPHITFSFTPDIIHYLVEQSLFHQVKEYHLSILSIRAPPLS